MRFVAEFFTQSKPEWVDNLVKIEKVRGVTVHKAGSKITTWLPVSKVYKL
jgi:hypothetical protein